MNNDTAKRGEYDTWKTVKTGEHESVSYKDKAKMEPITYTSEQPAQAPGFFSGFMSRVRRLATIALNLLIWAAWGTGGFYTGKLYGAPNFSQARAQFEIEGKKEDGERLFELGKACQDNSEMPMACKVLYFYQPEVMTARKF